MQQLPQLEAMCERLYNSQVEGTATQNPRLCPRGLRVPRLPWAAWAGCSTGRGIPSRTLAVCRCYLLPLPRLVCVLPTGAPLVVQNPQERAQAEGVLRVFGTSTEYVSHCKVRAGGTGQPAAEAGAEGEPLRLWQP